MTSRPRGGSVVVVGGGTVDVDVATATSVSTDASVVDVADDDADVGAATMVPSSGAVHPNASSAPPTAPQRNLPIPDRLPVEANLRTGTLSGADEAGLVGEDHGLGPVAQTELHED